MMHLGELLHGIPTHPSAFLVSPIYFFFSLLSPMPPHVLSDFVVPPWAVAEV